MWMQEVLDHLNKEINKISRNKIHILDHLAYTTSQDGNIEHALALTEEILTTEENRTLTKQERKDDMMTNDKQNLKLLSTVSQIKNYKINNTRLDDYFEEREIYDKTLLTKWNTINRFRNNLSTI
ncbi:unnamed protein product [Adineta steineri]|uniref:Prolyl 4-hydroxylase peptide-substrate-binding domain-containing protein n=1 Tax=Adineta steineri TaxID=433720 RepID=A0A815CRT1_9BILA|nr:unnamed protein product [Adineta steineri]CAF1567710.1 unnamed protein product [Adineta steineri]